MSTLGANDSNSKNETAFYVVLSLVFAMTVLCLGLGLWKSTERKDYVDREVHRVEAIAPKGEVGMAETQSSEYSKNLIREEANNLQNIITILFGVFQAGTGAIVGLLTGKVTTK